MVNFRVPKDCELYGLMLYLQEHMYATEPIRILISSRRNTKNFDDIIILLLLTNSGVIIFFLQKKSHVYHSRNVE